MNRRTLLIHPFQKLFSSKNSPSSKGIERYTGEWGAKEVKHLANRAFFFNSHSQKKLLEGLDMKACLDLIFSVPEELDDPINYDYSNDPYVKIGESWLNKPFSRGQEGNKQKNYRRASLSIWATRNLSRPTTSLKEKMVLFWHNHFVTADIRDPNFTYDYLKLFRDNPYGNFKELTKQITINSAMLRYLNGRDNTSKAPNENFARELLELFTIGKGDQVGPGDYTNYTEHDVAEIAKALTGWRDIGRFPKEVGVVPDSIFINGRHDKTVKKLSNRFGTVEIQNEMENEYKTVVDIIFEQEEVAKFFVRKLYRWFVYYEINDAVEMNVIEPLAMILRDSNYEVKPVLETLFASEHFYDENSRGCIIKSPIDLFVGMMHQFELPIQDTLVNEYKLYEFVTRTMRLTEMEYHNPPSVAGWQAYYQTPGYYRNWINSVSLVSRNKILTNLILNGVRIGDRKLKVDFLSMATQISNPKDPEILVREFVDLLLPMDLTDNQITYLLDLFLDGLPAYEWGVEYQNYLDNPDDENLKKAISRKIGMLLLSITNLPEYQLF